MSSSSEGESSEEEEIEETAQSRPRWVRGTSDFSDFTFHPSMYNLAAVDMDGYLNIYKVEPGVESTEIYTKRVSKKPCRCAVYTTGGEGIYIAGKAGSLRLFDVESGKLSHILMKGESPPYCVKVINQNLVASGDDGGTLKVWDIRKGKDPIIDEDRCHDFISSLAVDSNGKFLFATSGDGNMSTFNVKRRKFIVQSENAEFDMTCVAVAKNNKKVVVGTSEGLVLFYNWDEFAAPSDRFPGHPAPIECLAPISEDVICTGSMDGMIRAVHILPNRFLGVVGEHRNMPVGKISVSHDKKFIASSSHDSIIKFWNVEYLQSTSVDANAKPKKSLKTKKLVRSGVSDDRVSFLSDLGRDMTVPFVEDSDSGSEEESDAEEKEEIKNNNNNKQEIS